MPKKLLLAVVAVVVVIVAVIGWLIFRDTEPDSFELKGSVGLIDGARSTTNGGCEGKGGYADLSEGTSVTVSDASGTTIATGAIDASEYISGGACMLSFSFPVPTGSDFYKIEVSHRGEVTYPADKAAEGVSMTIGG